MKSINKHALTINTTRQQRRRRSSGDPRRAAFAVSPLAAGAMMAAVTLGLLGGGKTSVARAQVLPPAPIGQRAVVEKGAARTGIKPIFDPITNDSTQVKWRNWGPYDVRPQVATLMGPNFRSVTGRVNGIAYHPTRQGVYYAATASGGVWVYDPSLPKPLAGDTDPVNLYWPWKPLGDNFPTLKTSCIAIPQQDPRIIYVGTGDFDGRLSEGVGVMRSTNGGNTWVNVGRQLGTVSAIVVHPDNPKIVYATTRNVDGGRGFFANGTPNPNGHPSWGEIYVTIDGGENWTKITPATPLDDFQTPSDTNPKKQIGEGWSDIEIGLPLRVQTGPTKGALEDVNGDGVTPDRYVFAVNRRGGLYRALLSGPQIGAFERLVPTDEDPQFATGPYFSFRFNPVEAVADSTYPNTTPPVPDLHPDRNDPNSGGYGLELATSPTDGRTIYVIDSNANFDDGRLWRNKNGGARENWEEITGNFRAPEGTSNRWSLADYAMHMTSIPAFGNPDPVTGASTITDVLFGGVRDMLWSFGDATFTNIGDVLNPPPGGTPQYHADLHDMAFPKVYDGSTGKYTPQEEFLIASDGGIYRVRLFDPLSNTVLYEDNTVGGTGGLNRSLVASQFVSAAFHGTDPLSAFGGTERNGFMRNTSLALNADNTARNWQTFPARTSPLDATLDIDDFIEPDADLNPDTRYTIFYRGGDGVGDIEEDFSVLMRGITPTPRVQVEINGTIVGNVATRNVTFPDPTTDDGAIPGWQPTANTQLRVYSVREPTTPLPQGANMSFGDGGGAVYDQTPGNTDTAYATSPNTGEIYRTTDNWATTSVITPNRRLFGITGGGTLGAVLVNGAPQFVYNRANPQDTSVADTWNGETKAPVPAMFAINGRLYVGAQSLWCYEPSSRAVGAGGTDGSPYSFSDRGIWRRVGNTELAEDGAFITSIAIQGERCYVGTSTGQLWMTRNLTRQDTATPVPALNGAWISLNGPTLPSRLDPPRVPTAERYRITSISTNPDSRDSDILVGIDGKGVYRSQNTLGTSFLFTDQNGTIAGRRLADASSSLRVLGVARDTVSKNADGSEGDPTNSFFVATDRGVYFTNDLGSNWYDASVPLGLPYVECRTLEINAGTGFMNVATFGRGLWRFDLRNAVPVVTPVQLGATAAFSRAGTTMYVTVTVRNAGGAAQDVSIQGVTLAVGTKPATPTTTALPINLGTISDLPSSAKAATVTFPAANIPRASYVTLQITLNYKGATQPVVVTSRVRVP